MPRIIKMPRDPFAGRAHDNDSYILESPKARYIWVYTEAGARAIATQYADAVAIQIEKGVHRSTAYRIMQRLPRYWVCDLLEPESPRCFSVVKRSDLDSVMIYPKGNPNFRSGTYQQDLARRPRKKLR